MSVGVLLAGVLPGTVDWDGGLGQAPDGSSASTTAGTAAITGPTAVVVATLDTGVNPFHPDFRRDLNEPPETYLAGYPASTRLNLHLGDIYAEDFEASAPQLGQLRTTSFPAWVPGTNLIALWAHGADTAPVFDLYGARGNDPNPYHAHGARAASQIAGATHSMAPDALLAILDTSSQGPEAPDIYTVHAEALRWAADQAWIDIIHTNIQNFVPLARSETAVGDRTPYYMRGYPEAVEYAVAQGKLVVAPAGNFHAEPSETSPHAGIPGVLVIGANDNCGYSDVSNLNPHVVMDGHGTLAAAANGYGEEVFGGTSSSSALAAGYAARLLQDVRHHFRDASVDGDGLVQLAGNTPDQGPLADGRLTAAELHQVIRTTADPNPHASAFDGAPGAQCIEQPADGESAFYPKMGYGEVSEHTLSHAMAVLLGETPMPSRPVEDILFAASETARSLLWGP